MAWLPHSPARQAPNSALREPERASQARQDLRRFRIVEACAGLDPAQASSFVQARLELGSLPACWARRRVLDAAITATRTAAEQVGFRSPQARLKPKSVFGAGWRKELPCKIAGKTG